MAASRSSLLLLAVGCGAATGLLTPLRLPAVYSRTSPFRLASAPRACTPSSDSPPPRGNDAVTAAAAFAGAPNALAVAEAALSLGPRPGLSPLEVVEAQLALFKSAEDEDLEHCWSYFSPYGPTYDVSHAHIPTVCPA
jgi:hypothetical protein